MQMYATAAFKIPYGSKKLAPLSSKFTLPNAKMFERYSKSDTILAVAA